MGVADGFNAWGDTGTGAGTPGAGASSGVAVGSGSLTFGADSVFTASPTSALSEALSRRRSL